MLVSSVDTCVCVTVAKHSLYWQCTESMCGCRRSRSRRIWWSDDARLCAGRLCVPVPSTKLGTASMRSGCRRIEIVVLWLLTAAALVVCGLLICVCS